MRAGRSGAQKRGPGISLWVVHHERAPFVPIALPRGPAGDVQDGGTGIEHPHQPLPRRRGEFVTVSVGFNGAHKPELED